MRSNLHDGGSTSKVDSSTSHPTERRCPAISEGESSRPSVLDISCGSTLTTGAKYARPSETVSTCLADESCVINCTNRAEENSARDWSTVLSNRREASDESLCRREFFAIATGSKRTASTAIREVVSVISDSSPPIVPAKASGFLSSQTIKSSGSSVRSCPSRVVNFITLPARLIERTPEILSASNA
ncbi:unannotated protein [freshwater metagenome]|uniref:Unannotated protein n=1 Tax=freshwater metagenome TaxID=449393 RepID=A0A6J5ZGX3_9ZZZZ